MDSSAIAAMVVFIVALSVTIAMVVAWRRKKRLLAGLSEFDRSLHDRCRAADKAVREAQKRYDHAVKTAKKALALAETPEKTAQIDGRNYVTRIDVRLNGNLHALTADVFAKLDLTGDIEAYATRRSTLTRVAVGAAVGGGVGALVGGLAQKNSHHKIDNRELYLMILGPDWQEVVKVDPRLGEKARSMMQSINVNAQNVVAATAAHMARVAGAQEELSRVIADTRDLDNAKAMREECGTDPLESAKRARKQGAAGRKKPDGMLIISGDLPQGDGPRDVV